MAFLVVGAVGVADALQAVVPLVAGQAMSLLLTLVVEGATLIVDHMGVELVVVGLVAPRQL